MLDVDSGTGDLDLMDRDAQSDPSAERLEIDDRALLRRECQNRGLRQSIEVEAAGKFFEQQLVAADLNGQLPKIPLKWGVSCVWGKAPSHSWFRSG